MHISLHLYIYIYVCVYIYIYIYMYVYNTYCGANVFAPHTIYSRPCIPTDHIFLTSPRCESRPKAPCALNSETNASPPDARVLSSHTSILGDI